jgi:hypothetical protein
MMLDVDHPAAEYRGWRPGHIVQLGKKFLSISQTPLYRVDKRSMPADQLDQFLLHPGMVYTVTVDLLLADAGEVDDPLVERLAMPRM